jgi:hypothetical protein
MEKAVLRFDRVTARCGPIWGLNQYFPLTASMARGMEKHHRPGDMGRKRRDGWSETWLRHVNSLPLSSHTPAIACGP